jgi:hypothetical protein
LEGSEETQREEEAGDAVNRAAIVRVMVGAALVALGSASSGASNTATLQGGQTGLPDWDKANEAVRRLPPSAFRELPSFISSYLQRRGCTVPQHVAAQHASSVLSGSFTSPGQIDWAVLCSVRRVSTILVFRNGSTGPVAELARRDDRNSLSGQGDGTAAYDREIDVAAPGEIEAYKERYKTWSPTAKFDHDGIEDGSEHGSSIFYWSGKYWYEFPGAD